MDGYYFIWISQEIWMVTISSGLSGLVKKYGWLLFHLSGLVKKYGWLLFHLVYLD